MAGKIVLITGGARSGKSSFAEQYAAAAGEKIAYIATAQIYDQEMERRVALHRRRRPANWQTFEAPYRAELAMAAAAAAEVILFDCLTLYTSNLMLSPEAPTEVEARQQYILDAVERLLQSAVTTQKTVIFVTNEVGMAIVPENALAREYRDIAGWVNQKAARYAGEVYLIVCGLPVTIKKPDNKEV